MAYKPFISASCFCLTILSFAVNAAVITHGYLTTDDDGSSNIITDSLNNVEYLRLDLLADLTYAQTVAVLNTQDGGGWSIATSVDAINFTRALLGGSTTCSHNGTSVTVATCGLQTGWVAGDFGDDFVTGPSGNDDAWFLDDNGEADYVILGSTGYVFMYDFTLNASDAYSASGAASATPISWLLVRPLVVPVPATVWLFGSGLIGLIGVARRKARA